MFWRKPDISHLRLLVDTCKLRSNGMPVNICLSFSGAIAKKGLIPLLPSDYEPEE